MWPFCLFMHNNICQAFHKQLHQCSSIGAREAERAIQRRRRRRRRRRCVESCCTVRTSTWYTKDRTHHPPVLVLLKTPFVHTIAPPRQSGRLLWPKHEGFSLLTALMLCSLPQNRLAPSKNSSSTNQHIPSSIRAHAHYAPPNHSSSGPPCSRSRLRPISQVVCFCCTSRQDIFGGLDSRTRARQT